MAPRLISLADADRIIANFDGFLTQEMLAYAREQRWTRRTVEKMLRDPDHHVAIDPATETLGVGIIHHEPETLEISVLFTLTTGALAAREAADRMLAWALRRAQAIGITEVWGDYTFPPGVDVDTTRALRYFDVSLRPATTTTKMVLQDGTYVRIEADLVTLLARVEARLP